jgi:hypothetical protein
MLAAAAQALRAAVRPTGDSADAAAEGSARDASGEQLAREANEKVAVGSGQGAPGKPLTSGAIFKIMTARLSLRYSISMAVELGASNHYKNLVLHGDIRLFLLSNDNL